MITKRWQRTVIAVGLGLAILTALLKPSVAQTSIVPNTSTALTLQDPNPETAAEFGTSVLMADLNGDGHSDAVVGSPLADVNGLVSAGHVSIFFGPAYSTSPIVINDLIPEASALFGKALAAGDLNKDGIKDLIVSASGSDVSGSSDAGEVFVLLGSQSFDDVSDFTLRAPSPRTFAEFGSSLATGDINDDGIDDLIVGAVGNEEAFVFLGGNLFNSISDFTLHPPASASADFFGYAIAIGDVNGDKIKDAIITAPHSRVGNASSAGQAFVFLGGANFDTSSDFTLQDPNPNPNFLVRLGVSIVAGDINGDNIDDLMIASFGKGPRTTTGEEILIYFGASPFNTSIDAMLVNPSPESGKRFAPALACGDLNGDNVKDVVMGISGISVNGIKGAGKAFIVYGDSPFNTVIDSTLQDPNPEFQARFGGSVAIADPKADILVGANGSAIFTTGQRDFWGVTDDGYTVSFDLSSNGTSIEPFSITFFGFSLDFDYATWQTNYPSLSIVNNQVRYVTSNDYLQGTFITPDQLEGAVFSRRFMNGKLFQSDSLNFFAKRGGFAGEAFVFSSPVTSIESKNAGLTPSDFVLEQNYPNPFNPSTTISFTLPRPSFVTLKVSDILGKEVATLVAEQLPTGRHRAVWNASGFASGVYFYHLQAGEFVETKKLLLLK